jgi:hypothetical protein
MTDYQYPPLPDPSKFIRRATIQPGSGSDDIVIDLEILPFSDADFPEYEALSYAWGATVESVPVRVGGPDGAVTSLTHNLAEALRHLRLADRPRAMWIDALCINQSDTAEKGPQVAMMGTIFRRASRVIAWLGPAAPDSDHALRILALLGAQLIVDWGTQAIMVRPGTLDRTIADGSVPLDFSRRDFDAVYGLLARNWFDRLWIRQEIHLAAQAVVRCGQYETGWPGFRRALYCMRMKPVAKNEPIRLTERLRSLRGFIQQHPVISLTSLRENFGLAECNDPRDRLYAVLDLLDKSYAQKIVPDYTKSSTEVFRDAVVQWIGHHKSLDILQQCYLEDEEARPSWIADWSKPSFTWGRITLEAIQVSAKLAAWYEIPMEGCLRVAGVAVTRIEQLYSTEMGMAMDVDYKAEVSTLQRILKTISTSGISFGRAGFIETITSLFSAERHNDSYEPPSRLRPDHDEIRRFVEALVSPKFANQPKKLLRDDELYYNYEVVRRLCRDRQVFVGTNDAIGLVPANVRSGDLVCALLGSKSTIVLRPTADNHYLVVGECITLGISAGEAFLGELPEMVRLVRVETRRGALGFKDVSTGSIFYEDPRLSKLPTDLTEYREQLEANEDARLKLDPNDLRQNGVAIQYFDLI